MTNQKNKHLKEGYITKLIQAIYGWACERLYHEFAWGYDVVSWLVSGGRWHVWRGAALEEIIGPSVLELGFGTGELLAQMARRDLNVHGVDLSPAMHQVAKRKITRTQSRAHLCLARAQALPYPDSSFQTIVSTFPAPYILDPQTLQECVRLLTPPDSESGVNANNPDEQIMPIRFEKGAKGRQGSQGGRLVIVGMWVSPHRSGLFQHIPVFFGSPTAESLHALASPFREVGLEPTFKTFQDRWADVSVIVAEVVPRH